MFLININYHPSILLLTETDLTLQNMCMPLKNGPNYYKF
jgi:hypothetical protein